MAKITGTITFTPKWWIDSFGLSSKSPMDMGMDEQLSLAAKKSRLLFGKYGHLGLGSANPDPVYSVPQYDGRVLTASAYGGKRPGWDPVSESYWWDKSSCVWGDIDSPADVAKIKVPDWDSNPLVCETLERYEKEKSSDCYKRGQVTMPWTSLDSTDPRDGERYRMLGYMSVVDLSPFMYGDTEFFTVLLADPDLAFAIMDKCYEISTSYAHYMEGALGLSGTMNGYGSIGGDYSCMLSPSAYETMIKPYDLRRMEETAARGLQYINLHSCGKSPHLYDVWAAYPMQERIKVMQTRGVEGELAHVRRCLPHTWVQWTLCQPQCDFESIDASEVARLIRTYSADAGYENIEFTAIVTKPGDNTDRNIEAYFTTMEAINREYGLV